MNPYLEQNDTWEDFHHSFLIHAREALTGQVGPNYLVKIEVRLILHELSAEERRFIGRADVGVIAPPTAASSASSPAAFAAPVELQLPAVEVERHSSIEIRDRRNRRVVTVIELLSPSNKAPGSDRDDYLAKRRQVLAGMTHLVEIDLRRGGKRPTPPELPACEYYVLVSRYEQRPKLLFWPFGLRQRLPVVPIPLLAPDPDAALDLHAVLDRTYDAAGYGKYIYGESPDPPLSAKDEAWARTFAAEPGQGSQ
jgi:hypothetical protein